MTKTTIELIKFKLISMPCCGNLLCWVNPRWPSYCPTCGKLIYPDVKAYVVKSDDQAELTLHVE